MEYVLETNNLEKRYGRFKAISNLNMQIEKGSIYGLVGKNGAGKTNLLDCIIKALCGQGGGYVFYII